MSHKILIIDDEPAMIFILKSRLQAAGYEIMAAENGTDALAVFQSEKPGLVITDVMMPGMTGYEFFEALRHLEGPGKSVPVIVTSARGSMAQFFDKWAIRCFIPKPIDMPKLLEEIKMVLEAQEALAAIVSKKVPVTQSVDQRTVLLAGVSEYEIREVKVVLEQNHCCVV